MDGHAVHIKEEQARERGEFLEALRLSDEATLLYQKEGNIVGLSEIQAARFEIFKHLYLDTNDKSFLILGKMAAKAGVKIAENSGRNEALAIPLFCLGKAKHLLGKHDKAIEVFKKALEMLPQSPHNRPSVESDLKVHLAICEFMKGDQTALERAENEIKNIESSDELRYEKDVWVSGGYLKLAEATGSKDYLEKARVIIESNPELKLRKQQLEKLSSKLKA